MSREPGQRRDLPDWEQLYRDHNAENMPWYFAGLDEDIHLTLERLNMPNCLVLDVGCGAGTQAVALARLGYRVTAADVSPSAVATARRLAQEKEVTLQCLVDDMNNSAIAQTYDIIVDRACFNVLHPEQRDGYVRSAAGLLNPGGWLLLKCFSHLDISPGGPYRFSPEDLQQYFGPLFRRESISHTSMEGNRQPLPKMLFTTMQKR